MADVDLAVRLLNFACTDEYKNSNQEKREEIIRIFQRIPQKNIPYFFRKLDNHTLTNWFYSINTTLRDVFSRVFNKKIKEIKSDSKSNFEGSDLVVVFNDNSSKSIELKFGAETLRQFGLGSMDLMFPIKNHPNYFVKKLGIIKNNQVSYAKSNIGDQRGLIKRLREQLEIMCAEMNNLNENKFIQLDSNEIEKQLSGTGSTTKNSGALHPEKFIITDSKIEHKPFEDYSGTWTINSIKVSNQKGKARLEIWISNKTMKVKYLLNWKNNLVICGFKYRSITGVNSYCFNVWSYRI